MDYKEESQKALERAKQGLPLDEVFPELKESEDEGIIRFVIDCISELQKANTENAEFNARCGEAISYLEKEKEQKPAEKQDYSGLTELERAIHRGFLCAGVENVPVTIIKETAQECLARMKPAEWSEEFLRLMGITISQDGNQVCVLLGENLAEGIAGFGDTLADAVEEFKKEWRQFDRFRKATWKPSEEQPEVELEKEIYKLYDGEYHDTEDVARHFYELGLNARKEK